MISASRFHLVRVGILGHVGRFCAVDHAVYARGTRVVCRTSRGLEVGEVLSQASILEDQLGLQLDGELVRGMTAEDELLLARMNKNRDDAYAACAKLLDEHRVAASLVDVETLLDGRAIYFYFLGKLPSDIQVLVDQLGDTYEAKVKFRDFVKAAEQGCGPDCGTENAAGCGDSCASCVISKACKS